MVFLGFGFGRDAGNLVSESRTNRSRLTIYPEGLARLARHKATSPPCRAGVARTSSAAKLMGRQHSVFRRRESFSVLRSNMSNSISARFSGRGSGNLGQTPVSLRFSFAVLMFERLRATDQVFRLGWDQREKTGSRRDWHAVQGVSQGCFPATICRWNNDRRHCPAKRSVLMPSVTVSSAHCNAGLTKTDTTAGTSISRDRDIETRA